MTPKEYPFQNRALKNIKGEKWKDLPGLTGYFMISNYGRVKRLEYELEFIDGRTYRMNSLIMKPTVAKSPNHFVNDTLDFMRITLTVAGNIHNFSIARLVYFCFIQPFDWKDENLMVICKDRNGKNIRISNLKLVSRSERHMRVIAGGRSENVLLRKEIREKALIGNRIKNSKIISQYDRKGKRLMTFDAIPKAAKAVKISVGLISNVLRERKVTAAGYFWRYGAEKEIDIDDFLRRRKETNKCFHGKKITQYDLNGKKIATYISISEAARRTGAESVTIGKVVNGKRRTAGGFFWKKAPK